LNKPTQTNCLFPVAGFDQLKEKVLNWANRFGTFCFLDNHGYRLAHHSEECLLAAGVRQSIKEPAGKALSRLQQFIDGRASGKWLFGHLGYNLKNEIESLESRNENKTGFAGRFFFEPEYLIRLNEKQVYIEADNPGLVFEQICNTEVSEKLPSSSVNFKSRFSKSEYTDTVKQLKRHILRGDCYEINFCQEFYSEDAVIEPLAVYKKLSAVSPNPFSTLYRVGDSWLICASPERFLRKEGDKIPPQPIKGTTKPMAHDMAADDNNKTSLQQSAKDRSENVMVVDLVRNDLSKICKEGTVRVDELFGIYSFPQVHQMVSAISGELKEGISFEEIIRATFPMGSMTGAPKKRVMELIEQYERSARGIFSGAVGYISPGQNNFDFNVVIRSIMYNAASGYLSYQVGSGITYYSEPEKEWEECLLKAEAIKQVLGEGDNY